MERRYACRDRKTRYCPDVSPSQLDPWSQCDPILKNSKLPFFLDIDKLILKLIWKSQKTQNKQPNTEEVQRQRANMIWLKTYSKATVIKTVWYLWKDRQIDQQNRIETHVNVVNWSLTKRIKAIQWRKDRILNQWFWNNWTYIYKKKCRHRPYMHHKN